MKKLNQTTFQDALNDRVKAAVATAVKADKAAAADLFTAKRKAKFESNSEMNADFIFQVVKHFFPVTKKGIETGSFSGKGFIVGRLANDCMKDQHLERELTDFNVLNPCRLEGLIIDVLFTSVNGHISPNHYDKALAAHRKIEAAFPNYAADLLKKELEKVKVKRSSSSATKLCTTDSACVNNILKGLNLK